MIATGWYIAGGILLFILILLIIPVVIHFDYSGTLRIKAKYLCFTVYRNSSKKKPKKKKKKSAKAKKGRKQAAVMAERAPERHLQPAEDTAKPPEREKKPKKPKKEKDPKKPTLPEIFELVKVAVDSLGKPLKKLCRRIRICDFDLYMVCGGEDAAKAALNFGTANLAVTNALGWLGCAFRLKKPRININCDFQSEETITECFCKVKLNLLIVLAFVFTLLGRLIARVLKNAPIKAWLARASAKPKKEKKTEQPV